MANINRNRRRIYAADEEEVVVAPEVSDLLFEAEDVAELVAEVTGEVVEVEADEDKVVFTVGEDTFTVEADGEEEIVEATRRAPKASKKISANRRTARPGKRDVSASKNSKIIRKIPSSK